MSKKLNFEIGADIDGLNRSLDKATNQISIFGKKTQASLDRIGSSFQRVGSKLTVGLTLPISALGAASVKAASDAEETASKFETVFRDISASAQESANLLRDSYGLSRQASQALLSDTGDLLTGFGFTQKSALNLATEVNKLAVDLASFTNFAGGAEGASQALTKALLGERESVKSLGISILETDVQARVLLNTQQGMTFETERQAKAYATLQIAQEQSKNAIGDYERTAGSFANQVRLLKARVADLSAELGKVLLPFVNKAVTAITKVVNKFSGMEESTKKIIVVVAGLAAAIGPVLIVLGTLLKSLPAIGAALTLLTGPVGLVVAAIAGLTYVIYKNWDVVKQWAEDVVNYFIELYNESLVFRAGIEALALNFKNMFAVAKFIFQSLWSIIKLVVSNIVAQFKLLGAIIKAAFNFDWDELERGLQEYERTMTQSVGDLINNVKRDYNELTDSIVGNIETAINNVMTGKKDPVTFKASKASVNKLSNDIAQGVNEGVKEGIKSALEKREIIKKAVEGLESSGVVTSPPTTAESGSLSYMDEVEKESKRLFELTKNLIQDLDHLVTSSLSKTFSDLVTAIGEALANGGNVVQAIGNSLLKSLGNFLSELGGMLIEYGVMAKVKGALDEAIEKGGTASIAAGAAAIAVGIALKAAGAAIASRANAGLSGGGGVRGASTVPTSSLRQYGGSGGGGNEYVFRISGRDLVSVIDRNRNHLDIIGG